MKIIKKIQRRALIIHNERGLYKYLPGVSKDKEHIKNFLQSDNGGAWNLSEITTAPNSWSSKWLEGYFRENQSADYYLIFFVGHGRYDTTCGSIYSLPDGEEITREWLKKQTYGVSTFLITDSCLGIEKFEQGGILEHKTFSKISDDETRRRIRNAYDNELQKLPVGMFVTASSVSPGEEAGESDNGGHYISSLINVAKDIVCDNKYPSGIYGIGYIHSLASERVRQLSKGKQTPLLEGYTRSHQPPFMVKL